MRADRSTSFSSDYWVMIEITFVGFGSDWFIADRNTMLHGSMATFCCFLTVMSNGTLCSNRETTTFVYTFCRPLCHREQPFTVQRHSTVAMCNERYHFVSTVLLISPTLLSKALDQMTGCLAAVISDWCFCKVSRSLGSELQSDSLVLELRRRSIEWFGGRKKL